VDDAGDFDDAAADDRDCRVARTELEPRAVDGRPVLQCQELLEAGARVGQQPPRDANERGVVSAGEHRVGQDHRGILAPHAARPAHEAVAELHGLAGGWKAGDQHFVADANRRIDLAQIHLDRSGVVLNEDLALARHRHVTADGDAMAHRCR
jgi:hypothetical protein